ncbi:hypothetical protein [Bordetella sp. 02P26C-1]|uniref:hypothetical protein n=1 Tax=Bordetella sp. 02P26C-1 TaxID=2683195 RepID=UPI001921E83B|nr:hypothetical protein [Bordetella sp. 02P26C-1]
MTDTEKLLAKAHSIACRQFGEPCEKTAMDLFQELCAERDRRAGDTPEAVGATVH